MDVDIGKHRVPKYVNRRKLIIFFNGNKTRDGSIPSARMVAQGVQFSIFTFVDSF